MSTEPLILLLIGSLALLSLLLGLWLLLVTNGQRKELRYLRQQLTGLPEESVTQVDSPLSSAARDSFSARLNEVEQQRKQAAPVTPSVTTPRNPAEKYSYFASLAGQGISAAQIADALQMAPAEVDQLLRLASLKRGS